MADPNTITPPVAPGAASTDQGPTPFAAIASPDAPAQPFMSAIPRDGTAIPEANRYTPEQTQTTAGLATLAQYRTGLSKSQVNQQSSDWLMQDLQANKDLIESGQEKTLRAQIAGAAKNSEMQAATSLTNDAASGKFSDETGLQIKDFLGNEANVYGRDPDPDALEKQGVQHIQETAVTDPDQAVTQEIWGHSGNFLGYMRDQVIKAQLFGRELDALKKAQGGEGLLHKISNLGMGMLPLSGVIAQSGNVPGAPGSIIPGKGIDKQVGYLWSLPLDQFQKVLPQVFNNFTQTELGFGQNLDQAVDTATMYANGGLSSRDQIWTNAGAIADAVSVLPFTAIGKVPSKLVRVLGSRDLSSGIVASALAKSSEGVASRGVESLQTPAHVIEESLPSSLVPDTISMVRPDVGVVSDVADKIDQTRKATRAVLSALPKVDRLTPQQLGDAIDATMQRIKLQFKDQNIVDIKRSIPETEPGHFPNTTPTELYDPEADLDSISALNARDNVYVPKMEAGTGPRSALTLQDEHEAQLQAIHTEAGIKASGRPLPNTSDFGNLSINKGGPPVLSRSPDTGLYSINLYLGRDVGNGGFLSEDAARAAATRKGMDPSEFSVIRSADGQHYVKYVAPIDETKAIAPALKLADFKGVWSVSQYFKKADSILPDLFNRARVTQTIAKSRFDRDVAGPWIKNIQAVKSDGRDVLHKIAVLGERDQKWYDINEFNSNWERLAGRPPTDKETLAYYSAKELNDLNYHIENNAVRTEKMLRGMKTVRVSNEVHDFDTGDTNGRVIENPNFNSLRVHDLDENRTFRPGENSEDLKAKFDSGKYKVIELEVPHTQPGGDPIKHILAGNSDVDVRPLKSEQLGYVAGGSRENSFKWFGKQARSGQFEDGTKYWQRPMTHVAARTRTELQAWVDSMENARNAFNNPALSESEKRLLIERTPIESMDKFQQMVDDGTIDPKHPFEVTYDKQTPNAMSHIGEKDYVFTHDGESSNEAYNISKGRMYYSAKGDRLRDPSGEYAEILDPFQTLGRATENAARTLMFGDYNRQVISEWSKVAGPLLDRDSQGLDSFSQFMRGTFSDDAMRNANPEMRQLATQLQITRNTQLRLWNMRSQAQTTKFQLARNVADWLESKGKWGQMASAKALDMMSSNPVAAVKGVVFDLHDGFWNTGQMLVWAQTAIQALTANPLHGLETAAMAPWTTLALMNRSENVLDYLSKGTAFLHQLDPQDWKAMIRSLRDSGWLNVGGEQVYLDNYINKLGSSAIGQGWNALRQSGRSFVYAAEKVNRATAYQMAWKEVRGQFPKLAADDPEFLRRVNLRADDFSMNMTTASRAFWQKGPLSIPTQMMSYQFRALENLLPKFMGGSDRFKASQKLNMMLGGMLLYGAAGVPGGRAALDWAAEQYQQATGTPLSPDTWRALHSGTIDAMIHSVTGYDTDLAERQGNGTMFDSFVQRLFSGKFNSFISVMGGRAESTGSGLYDGFTQMINYMRAEQAENLSTEDWGLVLNDVARQVATFRDAQKAWWLWKTGTIRDPNTGEAILNEDRKNAVTALLGIPSQSETTYSEIYDTVTNREQNVQDMGKQIASVRRQAFQALDDGDPQKMDYYFKLAAGLMAPYRDDPLQSAEIAQAADKNLRDELGQTKYERLINRFTKLTGGTAFGEEGPQE